MSRGRYHQSDTSQAKQACRVWPGSHAGLLDGGFAACGFFDPQRGLRYLQ